MSEFHAPKFFEHVNAYRARNSFSKLLARVEAGEEIVLCRAGRPIARLVPERIGGNRRPGQAHGALYVDPDFNKSKRR